MTEKMFCYQCQEAARNTGCTIKGVCGKSAEVANIQYAALEMTKIIAFWNQKAREFQMEQKEISHLIVRILFATITNANFDDDWFINRVKDGAKLSQSLQIKLKEK